MSFGNTFVGSAVALFFSDPLNAVNLVASVIATLGLYSLIRIFQLIYEDIRSPLRSVAGPRAGQWFLGNIMDVRENIGGSLEREWFHQYGRTFRLNGFFGLSQLYTRDTKALAHILSNSYVYQKSVLARYNLGRIVGPGVLVVEEDAHKQQNPAFGAPQIRELTGIFIEKSIQLRDVWLGEAAKKDGVGNIDVLSWLSKGTLDIIGLAGFNYKFNSLDPSAARDEFDEAFTTVTATQMNFMSLVKAHYPILRAIPTKMDTIISNSQAVMMRIGRELLRESKSAIAEGGAFQDGRTRDLLSLLVRANTSKDIPESQRLSESDEDVLAQVPTFLVAGHETTSTSATWALFALTQNVAAQKRLRDDMDELNALSYLDFVVRETLRLYAPVPLTGRVAMRDDLIPLSTPYTDVNGTMHESLRILKGQEIWLPILELNRDAEIWGPDALEFKPERWEASIPVTNSIPGVWGHMLTFLGGPRGCIGFRFSLVEMKALLFTLVRGLEFELALPAADIGVRLGEIVQRPIVLSDSEAGNQLPLLVRPYVSS
ncbi:cytochrome P450 [Mycena rebaudengoi]|nr:cytochrome P450 [Mycena rebaudengoi]